MEININLRKFTLTKAWRTVVKISLRNILSLFHFLCSVFISYNEIKTEHKKFVFYLDSVTIVFVKFLSF